MGKLVVVAIGAIVALALAAHVSAAPPIHDRFSVQLSDIDTQTCKNSVPGKFAECRTA